MNTLLDFGQNKKNLLWVLANKVQEEGTSLMRILIAVMPN